jgi:pheromone a factor receptor
MRRLEAVASTRRIALSHAERVRRIGLEIFVCFGLPCLQLVLRYVTQGHRYDIFEHIGCQIPSYVSWPHIVIQYIFPLVLAAGAAIYAGELLSMSNDAHTHEI